MYIEMEELDVVVRNYRVDVDHGGTVILVPVRTEGESEEHFHARGFILIGKDLRDVETIQCEWLESISIFGDADGPVATLKATELPRFLRADRELLPDSEVYVFDVASNTEDLLGHGGSLFVALPQSGFKKGDAVSVGYWNENHKAAMVVEIGGCAVLSHLAEEAKRVSHERDAIQSSAADSPQEK